MGRILFCILSLFWGASSLADEAVRCELELIPSYTFKVESKEPHESLRSDSFHRWDGWGLVDNENVLDAQEGYIYHRWSLSSDKRHGSRQVNLNENAEVHHLVSKDGQSWKDLGAIQIMESHTNRDKMLPFWSGEATIEDGELLLFGTEVLNDENLTQQIVLYRSKDGHVFHRDKLPILKPTESLGYTSSTADNQIMAWRDPYPFKDEEGQLHLFFATKALNSQGVVVPAVGHAISSDIHFKSWDLLPPMTLPIQDTQIEMPNVTKLNGEYVLIIGTTNRPSENTPKKLVKHYTRAFRSKSLSGPWEPVDGDGGIIHGLEDIYAFRVLRSDDQHPYLNKLKGMGFYHRHEDPFFLTPSPLIDLEALTF